MKNQLTLKAILLSLAFSGAMIRAGVPLPPKAIPLKLPAPRVLGSATPAIPVLPPSIPFTPTLCISPPVATAPVQPPVNASSFAAAARLVLKPPTPAAPTTRIEAQLNSSNSPANTIGLGNGKTTVKVNSQGDYVIVATNIDYNIYGRATSPMQQSITVFLRVPSPGGTEFYRVYENVNPKAIRADGSVDLYYLESYDLNSNYPPVTTKAIREANRIAFEQSQIDAFTAGAKVKVVVVELPDGTQLTQIIAEHNVPVSAEVVPDSRSIQEKNLDLFRKNFQSVLMRESAGGNAGHGSEGPRSAVNFIYNPNTSEVLYLGNPQEGPRDLKVAWQNMDPNVQLGTVWVNTFQGTMAEEGLYLGAEASAEVRAQLYRTLLNYFSK